MQAEMLHAAAAVTGGAGTAAAALTVAATTISLPPLPPPSTSSAPVPVPPPPVPPPPPAAAPAAVTPPIPPPPPQPGPTAVVPALQPVKAEAESEEEVTFTFPSPGDESASEEDDKEGGRKQVADNMPGCFKCNFDKVRELGREDCVKRVCSQIQQQPAVTGGVSLAQWDNQNHWIQLCTECCRATDCFRVNQLQQYQLQT
jgi:type IV secretory pathway VirB10-like protein